MSNIPKYKDNNEFGIKATPNTPFVWFTKSGNLYIKGRSIHEDGLEFIQEVNEWIDDYLENPNQSTILTIELEYLNDITSKYLLKIIKQLENGCKHLIVNWKFDIYDEDLYDLGKILCSSSNAHFNFISLNE